MLHNYIGVMVEGAPSQNLALELHNDSLGTDTIPMVSPVSAQIFVLLHIAVGYTEACSIFNGLISMNYIDRGLDNPIRVTDKITDDTLACLADMVNQKQESVFLNSLTTEYGNVPRCNISYIKPEFRPH